MRKLAQLFPAIVIVVFAALGPLAAAQSAADKQADTRRLLDESIQELKTQVSELRQSVTELRTEAAQYRAEAIRLRDELQAARAQLSVSASPSAQTPTLAGQTPESGNQLQQRLSNLEESLQVLDGKVTDLSQVKVESGSRYRVRIFGMALFNLFGSQGTVDNIDVPTLAAVPAPGTSSRSAGGTLRQSTLGLEAFGPEIAGARTSGNIEFDFGGGFPLIPNGTTMGLARLRTATLRMDWARTSVVGGQDTLFFAPLAPTSLASVIVPPLAYAGNLWGWVPQLRLERKIPLAAGSDVSLQAGILDSVAGQVPTADYSRQPQAGEASGQPAYAGHVAWNRKLFEHPMTIGVGSYYGRQNWGFGRKVDGWAVVSDWDLPLNGRFALSGEFYRGRAIGGLGAAAGVSVLSSDSRQDPASSIAGLNSLGGWAQLKFTATPRVEFNAAFGQDNPFSADIHHFLQAVNYTSLLLSRNQSGFVNVVARPRSDLVLSLEYRHLRTYQVFQNAETAHQVNIGMGVLF